MFGETEVQEVVTCPRSPSSCVAPKACLSHSPRPCGVSQKREQWESRGCVPGPGASLSMGLEPCQMSEAASGHLLCGAPSRTFLLWLLLTIPYQLMLTSLEALLWTLPEDLLHSPLPLWKLLSESPDLFSCNSSALFICQIAGWTLFFFFF